MSYTESNWHLRSMYGVSRVNWHVSGPSRPDFVGIGGAAGATFDITTQFSWLAHQARRYGQGLIPVFYNLPSTSTRLP